MAYEVREIEITDTYDDGENTLTALFVPLNSTEHIELTIGNEKEKSEICIDETDCEVLGKWLLKIVDDMRNSRE